MRVLILITCLIILLTPLYAQDKIEDLFNLRWQNHIGITTFRTTIKCHEGKLYIPSNGNKPHLPGDEEDGIHILDAGIGKKEMHLRPDEGSVKDCNGIAISGRALYFGNDNGTLYCYDLTGKELWAYDIPDDGKGTENDIESAPVLSDLNSDRHPDVVFNVESRGIIALDGSSGMLLWEFTYPSHEGTYMNAPAAWDLNGDKVDDFIIGGKRDRDPEMTYDYRNAVYAINGKTGKPLWQYTIQTGVHASPVILKNRNDVEIMIAETYSDITFLASNGEFQRYINLNEVDGGISGLFATPVINNNNILFIGTSWWGDRDGIWICPLDDDNYTTENGWIKYRDDSRLFVEAGRVSSSAVIGDVLKSSKGQEALICTEQGEMLIFDKNGKLLERLTLPAGVEATPYLGDVDNDGKTEIIIACLNETIYCYDTNVRTKSRISCGEFRMDQKNTGVSR